MADVGGNESVNMEARMNVQSVETGASTITAIFEQKVAGALGTVKQKGKELREELEEAGKKGEEGGKKISEGMLAAGAAIAAAGVALGKFVSEWAGFDKRLAERSIAAKEGAVGMMLGTGVKPEEAGWIGEGINLASISGGPEMTRERATSLFGAIRRAHPQAPIGRQLELLKLGGLVGAEIPQETLERVGGLAALILEVNPEFGEQRAFAMAYRLATQSGEGGERMQRMLKEIRGAAGYEDTEAAVLTRLATVEAAGQAGLRGESVELPTKAVEDALKGFDTIDGRKIAKAPLLRAYAQKYGKLAAERWVLAGRAPREEMERLLGATELERLGLLQARYPGAMVGYSQATFAGMAGDVAGVAAVKGPYEEAMERVEMRRRRKEMALEEEAEAGEAAIKGMTEAMSEAWAGQGKAGMVVAPLVERINRMGAAIADLMGMESRRGTRVTVSAPEGERVSAAETGS